MRTQRDSVTCLKPHSRTQFLPTGTQICFVLLFHVSIKACGEVIGPKCSKVPYSANPPAKPPGPGRITKKGPFYCLKCRYRDRPGFWVGWVGPSLDSVGVKGLTVVTSGKAQGLLYHLADASTPSLRPSSSNLVSLNLGNWRKGSL